MKKSNVFTILFVFLFCINWNESLDSRERAMATDLFLAIEQKNTDTAIELLSFGIDLNVQDENGFTPLMYAVAVDDIKLVRHLVMYGADVKLKSQYGRTAFDYAKKLKRKSVIMVLGRTGEHEKIQMRINDKIQNIKNEINQNIFNSFTKDLEKATTWKGKQQLYRLKKAVKNLSMFEKKLKKLEEENPAYADRNIKERHAIATYKLRISSLMKKIKKYMEKVRKKKLLERLKRLEEIKKKLEKMRKDRKNLKKLEKESKRLKWDVDKDGAYNNRNTMHRVLSTLKSSYDKSRFRSFYKKGTGRILYTGNKKVNAIIANARRYIGQKYVFGGLDCSGLWYRAFLANGISFPRTAELQARYGIIIANKRLLKRGDLLFFTRTYTTYWFISHIGMYLGNNKMLHAATGGVMITQFPYPGHWWKSYYVFATRVF